MKKGQKYTGRTMSVPGGLAVGMAVSLGLTGALTLVLGKLVEGETLLWENVGYGVMAMLLLSSFLGALAAYGKIRRQRLMVCLMAGGVYFCTLLSVTALFFGGQYHGVGVTFLLVLAGSGAAGLLGLRRGRGEGKKHIRRR